MIKLLLDKSDEKEEIFCGNYFIYLKELLEKFFGC